ncbi:MAG: alanine--glyoxylate aminotransferase family protein [Leptospirales bacterium]|nr:alanine--glyoxylate aminotransferase family protein [Leptospirales bacterium]
MPAFSPPEVLLLGPGPSNPDPRTLLALARPTIGHLDPRFVQMMDQTRSLLRFAFQCKHSMTLPLSAPASAAMEFAFVNLLAAGDRALICTNGVFGQRMAEIARRRGAIVQCLDFEWGRAIDPEAVQKALQIGAPPRLLAFVQAETSTGAQSDAATLCRLAHQAGALTIVDSVTALGGTPVEAGMWEADLCYAGSQKCLSAPPGLAPLSIAPRALEQIQMRTDSCASWFFDAGLLDAYWSESRQSRSYHHTAPVNQLYALHQSLQLLEEEGLEEAWQRHRRVHKQLLEGLGTLGLQLLPPEEERLPQLNAVLVPEGVDEAAIRRRLLLEHDIEIGGGLGPLAGKVWRIGLMGYNARPACVERVLLALSRVLERSL